MRDCARFENLWRTHGAELERFVRRRVGCPEQAADIASEVFVTVGRALAEDPSREINVGFLFTVANRRVVDSWRRKERDRRLVERCGSEMSQVPFGSSIDEDLGWLDGVPERQRVALALRYLDDLSVSQVAGRMGETYGVVESLLARARASARNEFATHRIGVPI